MIARIEFTYTAREKFTKLDDAAVGVIASIIGTVPEPKDRASSWAWPSELLIDMEEDGPILIAYGLPFEVKNFKGTMPISAVLPSGQKTQVYIQVPHIGLLAMDEVKVCEDYCTQALQSELDNGWRILCVCPPNAARRPDYILGRTKDRSRD